MPPIYVYKCECGQVEEAFRTMNEHNNAPYHCDQKMRQVITAPMISVDIPAYVSPASGKVISGRRQRMEDFKRTGTRPWEGLDVEKREAQKVRDDADNKFEKEIEKGAYEVLNNMPADVQRVIKSAD